MRVLLFVVFNGCSVVQCQFHREISSPPQMHMRPANFQAISQVISSGTKSFASGSNIVLTYLQISDRREWLFFYTSCRITRQFLAFIKRKIFILRVQSYRFPQTKHLDLLKHLSTFTFKTSFSLVLFKITLLYSNVSFSACFDPLDIYSDFLGLSCHMI